MRRLSSVALAIGLLFQVACSDSALIAIAKQMPIAAAADKAMANTVVSAQAAGAITVDEARPLIQIDQQFALAGKQVDAAVAGISALTPAQRASVLAILRPVITAVNNETSNIQIGNAATKTEVQASLVALQTALAVIAIALGGK